MELLLTILSVLAVWLLLGVLCIGIYLIRKTLESVRIYLEKIAMGVRAIERQTAFTEARSEKTAAAVNRTEQALSEAAEKFVAMERLVESGQRTIV